MLPDLITAAQAGEMIGVTARTFRSYSARGIADCPEPVMHVGRTPLWDRQAVQEWHDARPRVGRDS